MATDSIEKAAIAAYLRIAVDAMSRANEVAANEKDSIYDLQWKDGDIQNALHDLWEELGNAGWSTSSMEC